MRTFHRVGLAGLSALVGLALALAASAAGAAAASAAANRATAEADAAANLRRVVVPDGAVALAGAPAGAEAIDNAAPAPGTPDLIDDHAWWRASGTVASVIAFERAHAPAGSSAAGNGGGSSKVGGRTATWTYVQFALPARAGVLDSRSLIVRVTALSGGGVAVRADAQDVWAIPRAASERIPAGVTAIGIVRGAPHATPTVSATVTSAGKIATIIRWVDALPVVQPGVLPCPFLPADLPVVTFTFRGGGGRVLAQATQAPVAGPNTSCDPMRLTIDGRTQTPLLGGSAFLGLASRLLGLKLAAS